MSNMNKDVSRSADSLNAETGTQYQSSPLLSDTSISTSTRFRDNFWTDGTAGYEILMKNLDNSIFMTGELSNFLTSRALAEEEYVKIQSKSLVDFKKERESALTLRTSLEKITAAAESVARFHMQLGIKFRSEVDQPFAELIEMQRKLKRSAETEQEKYTKSIEKELLIVQKAASLYMFKCREYQLLEGKDVSPMIGKKEQEKMSDKILKARFDMERSELDFKSTISRYNQLLYAHEQKFVQMADQMQRCEELRITRSRDILKKLMDMQVELLAKLGPKLIEKSRNVLDAINETEDISNFIAENRTGNVYPTRLGFQSYFVSPDVLVKLQQETPPKWDDLSSQTYAVSPLIGHSSISKAGENIVSGVQPAIPSPLIKPKSLLSLRESAGNLFRKNTIKNSSQQQQQAEAPAPPPVPVENVEMKKQLEILQEQLRAQSEKLALYQERKKAKKNRAKAKGKKRASSSDDSSDLETSSESDLKTNDNPPELDYKQSMPVGEKIDAMLHSLGVDDVGDSIMSPINMESDGDLFEHAIQRKVSAVATKIVRKQIEEATASQNKATTPARRHKGYENIEADVGEVEVVVQPRKFPEAPADSPSTKKLDRPLPSHKHNRSLQEKPVSNFSSVNGFPAGNFPELPPLPNDQNEKTKANSKTKANAGQKETNTSKFGSQTSLVDETRPSQVKFSSQQNLLDQKPITTDQDNSPESPIYAALLPIPARLKGKIVKRTYSREGIVMEGWLEEYEPKSAHWNKVWVALEKGYLWFFNDPSENATSATGANEATKMVRISQSTCEQGCSMPAVGFKTNIFSVNFKTKKSLIFSATDELELWYWIEACTRVIASHNHSSQTSL